jgi:hypothetical protein
MLPTRLPAEQEELLAVLVEAFRSVPRAARHPALLIEPGFGGGGAQMAHNGLAAIGKPNYQFYMGDAKELAMHGLIRLEPAGGHAYQADITNDGFRYYESIKVAGGQPIERVETSIRNYLIGDNFERRHPASLAKWKLAETALWSSDSASQMTTIGHLCREAMQDFATESLGAVAETAEPNIQRTVSRMRTAIDARLTSESLRDFADALLSYWGTVVDLVQRQEHRASSEREDLSWEDARRAVFQTLVVMHEIDRALGTQ